MFDQLFRVLISFIFVASYITFAASFDNEFSFVEFWGIGNLLDGDVGPIIVTLDTGACTC